MSHEQDPIIDINHNAGDSATIDSVDQLETREDTADKFINIPELKLPRKVGTLGKWAGIGLLAFAGGFLVDKAGATFTSNSNGSSSQPGEQPTSENQLALENVTLEERMDLSLRSEGLTFSPDGHIPYFTTPEGTRRYFIVSKNSTWMIETNGESLENAIRGNRLTIKDVLDPNSQFQYRGITSVLQLDSNNPMHLIGITHQEQRVNNDPGTFTASVGEVESFDGGISWSDKGTIISGDDAIEPGTRATGAGQPDAIYNKNDGYVYIMYIDWASQQQVQHGDQLYLARAKANSDGSLGQVQYLTEDNGFASFEPGKLKSVIPAASISNGGYTALPSISFNHALNQYLCVFETNVGFFTSTSKDLVNWSSPKEIFDFAANGGRAHSNNNSTADFITYPSLLSDNYPTDQETGANAVLYFADRPFGTSAHELAGVTLTIK